MSPGLVPQAVEDYAAAHTTPAAAHLAELERETHATLGSPQMLTGEVEGRFLEMLVFLRRPRRVLEIGTFSGYSALSMVAALPADGEIVTLELSDERADFAERHIAAAGEAGRIVVRRGPAIESIATLDGPFDLVFIDADKASYRDYYEAVLPKLADDGVIAIDNVLWSGRVADPPGDDDDDNTRSLRAFNDHVAADERVVSVMLTIRDGVTLVRRA